MHFIFVFLFFICEFASSNIELNFLKWENRNSHFNIHKNMMFGFQSSEYWPQDGKVIELSSIYIPKEKLNFVGKLPQELENLFFRENDFKFLIHPSANQMYQTLFGKYEVGSLLKTRPTSSTRTLLSLENSTSFFSKVSLDSEQFGFGRVVAGSEVRKSVAMSNLLEESKYDFEKVVFIPEPFGVYFDVSENIKPNTKISVEKPLTYQHGMIVRSTDFLKEHSHLEILPLFALFEAYENNPPLIIQIWKDSSPQLSLEDFIVEFLIQPMTSILIDLVLNHGLLLESHAQNVLIGINLKTHKIEKFFIRDLGGIKVHPILRLALKKSLTPLLETDFLEEFYNYDLYSNLNRSFVYFFNHLFSYNNLGSLVLADYIPNYSAKYFAHQLFKVIYKDLQNRFPNIEFEIPNHISFETLNYNIQKAIDDIMESKNVPITLSFSSAVDLGLIEVEQKHLNNIGKGKFVESSIFQNFKTNINVSSIFTFSDFSPSPLNADIILNYFIHQPRKGILFGTKNNNYFTPIEDEDYFQALKTNDSTSSIPVDVVSNFVQVDIEQQIKLLQKEIPNFPAHFFCSIYFN